MLKLVSIEGLIFGNIKGYKISKQIVIYFSNVRHKIFNRLPERALRRGGILDHG